MKNPKLDPKKSEYPEYIFIQIIQIRALQKCYVFSPYFSKAEEKSSINDMTVVVNKGFTPSISLLLRPTFVPAVVVTVFCTV